MVISRAGGRAGVWLGFSWGVDVLEVDIKGIVGMVSYSLAWPHICCMILMVNDRHIIDAP